MARALLSAADIAGDGELDRLVQKRYQGWSGELGRQIEAGKFDLQNLSDLAVDQGFEPRVASGRRELAESLIARRCKY